MDGYVEEHLAKVTPKIIASLGDNLIVLNFLIVIRRIKIYKSFTGVQTDQRLSALKIL